MRSKKAEEKNKAMNAQFSKRNKPRVAGRPFSLFALLGVASTLLVLTGCDGSGGSAGAVGGNAVSEFAGVIPISPGVLCNSKTLILTAGAGNETGATNVGSITISNDQNYLYVAIDTDDPWKMKTTHVHVGCSNTDYPQTPKGTPIPGQFDYQHPSTTYSITHDEYAIPLTDIACFGTNPACPGQDGKTLYIWVHAEVAKVTGTTATDEETAFGGDIPGTGPRWSFYSSYIFTCCDDEGGDDGAFKTLTQGAYGTYCHGDNPGCYRDAWFDIAFPNGIELGCDTGFTATFTSSEAVRDFLPAGGSPGSLTIDLTDPVGSTDAGVLLGQLLAAELSVGFDAADPDFSETESFLINQIVCNTGNATVDALGLTVGELIDEANSFLGGCGSPSGLNAGDLVTALASVNENYDEGDIDLGYLCNP